MSQVCHNCSFLFALALKTRTCVMALLDPTRLKFSPSLMEIPVPYRSPMGSWLGIEASTIPVVGFLPASGRNDFVCDFDNEMKCLNCLKRFFYFLIKEKSKAQSREVTRLCMEFLLQRYQSTTILALRMKAHGCVATTGSTKNNHETKSVLTRLGKYILFFYHWLSQLHKPSGYDDNIYIYMLEILCYTPVVAKRDSF